MFVSLSIYISQKLKYMDILLVILGVICLLVGLAGCFLPILPGPPVAYLALWLLHFTGYALAASLGASKSDWWPKVFVKGSVGFASHDFDKLANHNSLTYEIAPTLTWNFFQGTQKIQATRLAKAQLDESIRQFNQTVLTSVQEVDNAMSSYKNSIKQIVALREVVNQGKQTLDLSLDLYKQGLTPFQNVLDAQRSLLTYQNQLTQAQGSSLLNLIQLYQSLGGGWNPM